MKLEADSFFIKHAIFTEYKIEMQADLCGWNTICNQNSLI